MIMIDRDFDITFVNASTTALLTKHEAAFRQIWPNFSAASIVGTSIDIFHKNPGICVSCYQILRVCLTARTSQSAT